MLSKLSKPICIVALLFAASGLYAQKQVGDTLSFSVLQGGGVTVPEGEEWQFLSLTYTQGAYGMPAKYEGADTLKSKDTWVAPFWSIEAQLLGDGKTEGMYLLKVIKIK